MKKRAIPFNFLKEEREGKRLFSLHLDKKCVEGSL